MHPRTGPGGHNDHLHDQPHQHGSTPVPLPDGQPHRPAHDRPPFGLDRADRTGGDMYLRHARRRCELHVPERSRPRGSVLLTYDVFVPAGTLPGTYTNTFNYVVNGAVVSTSSTTINVVQCTITGSGEIVGTPGNDVICGRPARHHLRSRWQRCHLRLRRERHDLRRRRQRHDLRRRRATTPFPAAAGTDVVNGGAAPTCAWPRRPPAARTGGRRKSIRHSDQTREGAPAGAPSAVPNDCSRGCRPRRSG